jgi:type II secretory pathway pseudopilin PulG
MRAAPGPSGPVRGFTLIGMMLAAIIAGLAVLFVVGGFFAVISDGGRIAYNIESDT